MNEVKFKVWCKNKKEWEKYPVFLAQNGALYHSSMGRLHLLEIENHIPCFYSGLKDKNEKEICEGDIVKWNGYEVKAGKQIRPERKQEIKRDFITLYRLKNIFDTHKELEIIGNIYENPEIIKKKD